ncbi:MAG: PAS domain-containing protein [Rhizomicrobium sp.]
MPEFAEPPIFVDRSLQFSRPENQKALAYWNSIRSERQMPARSALRPRAMVDFLTHVNLVDVLPGLDVGATDYQVTLQGSHGADVFGVLAHRKLSAGLSEVTARRLRECLNFVSDSGRPVRISSRVTGGDKFWLDSEHLMAPVGDEPGRITTIMWVFVSWPAPT